MELALVNLNPWTYCSRSNLVYFALSLGISCDTALFGGDGGDRSVWAAVIVRNALLTLGVSSAWHCHLYEGRVSDMKLCPRLQPVQLT